MSRRKSERQVCLALERIDKMSKYVQRSIVHPLWTQERMSSIAMKLMECASLFLFNSIETESMINHVVFAHYCFVHIIHIYFNRSHWN